MLADFQMPQLTAQSEIFGGWSYKAAERGHVCRGYFHGDGQTYHLAYPIGADLDSEFAATCLDTGELLSVSGWLFETEDDPTAPRNRAALHPVLHNALASGDCPPPVAGLIRDWGERDPVDAMSDARLVASALRGQTDLDRPEVSTVARRAYADFLRDYPGVESQVYADKLANVLTDWADTVLQEAIDADA